MTGPADPRQAAVDHGDWDALAAGWALSALEQHDEARFADHLPGCDRCTETVRESLRTVGDLAYAMPDAAPPPSLKRRITAAVALERGPAAPDAEPGAGTVGEGQWPMGARAGGEPPYEPNVPDWFERPAHRPEPAPGHPPGARGEGHQRSDGPPGAGPRGPVGGPDVAGRPDDGAAGAGEVGDWPDGAVDWPSDRAGGAGDVRDWPGGAQRWPGDRTGGAGEAGDWSGAVGGRPGDGTRRAGESPGWRAGLEPWPGDVEAVADEAAGWAGEAGSDENAGLPGGAGVSGDVADHRQGAAAPPGGHAGAAERAAPPGPPPPDRASPRPSTPAGGRHAAPDDGSDEGSRPVPLRLPGRRWVPAAAAAAAVLLIVTLGVWNVRLRSEQDDLRRIVALREQTIRQLTADGPARIAALSDPASKAAPRRATVVVRGDRIEVITETLRASDREVTYWLWTLGCDVTNLKAIRGFAVPRSQFSVNSIGSDPGFARAPCFAISQEVGPAKPTKPRTVVAFGPAT